MKPTSSTTWRAIGDYAAYSSGQWEFRSTLFLLSARRLREAYSAIGKSSPLESIAYLVTSQFNLALAIELIAKAYYLKANSSSNEAIYTHEVATLLPSNLLDSEQKELMTFAAQCVQWSGRYPTPKWDKEFQREKYDVPARNADQSFDPNDAPNRASLQIISKLDDLYVHIHTAFTALHSA